MSSDSSMTPIQAAEIQRLAKAVLWKQRKDIEKGRISHAQ